MSEYAHKFYQQLQKQLIESDKPETMISPIPDRATAVRIANFCRNCGYEVKIGQLGPWLIWVDVKKGKNPIKFKL